MCVKNLSKDLISQRPEFRGLTKIIWKSSDVGLKLPPPTHTHTHKKNTENTLLKITSKSVLIFYNSLQMYF